MRLKYLFALYTEANIFYNNCTSARLLPDQTGFIFDIPQPVKQVWLVPLLKNGREIDNFGPDFVRSEVGSFGLCDYS